MNNTTALFLWCLLLLLPPTANAWVSPIKRVQNDFLALTRRVTARHILVSNKEIAVALKKKIRERVTENNVFVVDAFEEVALKYSQDETSKANGGLLGTLVPQGYNYVPELDRACFEVTLGELEGPIVSKIGYHLLLVTERTNCPKLDGPTNKLIQTDADDVYGTLSMGSTDGRVVTSQFVLTQVGFWFLIFVAGGLVAELVAQFFD